ncbi:helix-turn-helix transcriptional regulator [Marivirga sp. S37H4]|uniref:Helix-turn-helix transcriptional regulator n=1 Tax=Marivirga aurantiaca TaxID=2802615 RepID=A0A934WVW3_9BACT|nr:PadR family transcriptional regulator [Marivirga aurantiaca]MBK6264023.1 helix-turn-helix transcriptional regulator [Marivirga aurantiaca]
MYSKELLKGTLGVIILKLLEENDRMYGYEICQKVKEISEGKILIKDGSLYPTLHKLLSDGIVTIEEVSMGKRIRKYYRLTPKGKTAKNEVMDELADFISTLQKIVFDSNKPFPAI